MLNYKRQLVSTLSHCEVRSVKNQHLSVCVCGKKLKPIMPPFNFIIDFVRAEDVTAAESVMVDLCIIANRQTDIFQHLSVIGFHHQHFSDTL